MGRFLTRLINHLPREWVDGSPRGGMGRYLTRLVNDPSGVVGRCFTRMVNYLWIDMEPEGCLDRIVFYHLFLFKHV